MAQLYKPETVRLAFSEFHVGPESDDGEQRMFCPLCEDPGSSASPSASINAEKMMWNCLKGNHGGGVATLIKDLQASSEWRLRSAAMKARSRDPKFKKKAESGRIAAGTQKTHPLEESDVKKWTDKLALNQEVVLKLMNKRGFTKNTIEAWELGWDGSRVIIPVRDEEGKLVNVRRYKMDAAGSEKMLNIPGRGEGRIFRPDILAANDVVVLTEGETDCIILNQNGIPAIAHTAGASTFKSQWAPMFAHKKVFVCYDNDEAGRKGSAKAAKAISAFADEVYKIDLPLDEQGADITDYFVGEYGDAEAFRLLMKEAQEKKSDPTKEKALPTKGKEVTLLESMSANSANSQEALEVVVSIAGKTIVPSSAPATFVAECDMSAGPKCNSCPVFAFNGDMTVRIERDSENLFRFLEATEDRQRKLLREVSGAKCRDAVSFRIEDKYVVEELIVQPAVDIREQEDQQQVRRSVYSINTHKTPVNRKTKLIGKNVVDPRDSRLQFMSWSNESVDTDLDKFEMTQEIAERLYQFQPKDGESPLDKCFDIAKDLSENVTHIYDSDLLHVAYDLVWHSALTFKIHDSTIDKGWLEMLVIGDTRTGKSEVAKQLSTHYNCGQIVSCEGMSFAGIVGGVQQVGSSKAWHMTWGVVPLNDRRLVVLDEMSGLKDKDVIEQMSSIRSSGVAQITKINSNSTSARTRLVWISNPGDGSMINDNPRVGMHAIGTVVNNAEDIARFDFCIAVSAKDVDPDVINSGFDQHHSPHYSSQDCSDLLLWAWSRKREDILISEKALDELTKQARSMGKRYVPDPPLIQVQNVRFKILRIAVAMALRTYSVHHRSINKVVVSKEHILDSVKFLDMVYDQPSMGYSRHSERVITAAELAEKRRQACKAYLLEYEDSVLLTLRMVGGRTFRTRDFTDFGGLDADKAKSVSNKLLSWRMATLKSRGDIAMSQTLIDIIKQIEDEEI